MNQSTDFEKPYPLLIKFKRIILPWMLVLATIFALVMVQGSKWLTQKVYLQTNQSRAIAVYRALEEKNKDTWATLQLSSNPTKLFETNHGKELLQTLRSEEKELGLAHLKIYGRDGIVLYSSNEAQIGTFDASAGFLAAANGDNNLVKKTQNNIQLYELYARVPNIQNLIVMELYEPIEYLDTIKRQFIIPTITIPLLLLLLIAWILRHHVLQAQHDINYRNSLLIKFREKLQKLVSLEAVSSLKTSVNAQQNIVSKRIKATILFSDIRGFTSYCDNEEPEKIVSFLNQSLSIVIEAINQHQGDIDKLIGDAVLGFFQGEGSSERALNAAFQAMEMNAKKNFPRNIGIGIFTGEVLVGTIGASNRMDFTLIGDTVNIASRLCSQAKEGEIIIDAASYQSIKTNHNDAIETLSVKGKMKHINIIRFKTT